MSAIAELVQGIRARGIKIWTEGGNIRVHGNVQALPSDAVDTLRLHKAVIVHHLEATQTAEEIPRLPRNDGGSVSLTATQTMPWHYTPRSRTRARSIAFAQRIRGPLNVEVLDIALRSLQDRHEALRIKFSGYPDEPRQYAQAEPSQTLELIDLSREANAEEKAAARLAEFVEQKIDYAEDPLFGTRLIKLAKEEHVLVCSVDHIVSDGISNQILMRDLWSIHEALAMGRAPDLPALQVQFLDHARWLERTYPYWLRTSGAYWRERLGSARPLNWPSPQDRGEAHQGPDEIAPFISGALPMDEQLQQQIHEIAQANRTLPALVMLTTYVASVLQWCDQEDLTVAVVDLGRYRPELAPVVGCLTQHLHLRVERSRGQSFLDLLETVKGEFGVASSHRDFDQVARIVPAFRPDLCFNWLRVANNATSTRAASDGSVLRLEPIPLKPDRSTSLELARLLPFKSMLGCWDDAGHLRATLYSSVACFTEKSAATFSEQFLNFMRTVCEQPASILATLPHQNSNETAARARSWT